MFDNLHIIDTLRNAGFEAGEINVTREPGVRDVTITGMTVTPRFDAATDAARALADAGYDILCYGAGLGEPGTIATLMVRLPKAAGKAA
tara:strand:- start:27 stop:293 length:267 start_codon:yes stop_codon:yes gene_type:complete